MPIVYQPWITRSDLLANPSYLFVFGDNMQRRGLGGQAREMRGEPNAVGIPTKHKPDNTLAAFFCDDDFDSAVVPIRIAFARLAAHLRDGGTVVVPARGIGTGLADLNNRAPRIYELVRDGFRELEEIASALHSSG